MTARVCLLRDGEARRGEAGRGQLNPPEVKATRATGSLREAVHVHVHIYMYIHIYIYICVCVSLSVVKKTLKKTV